MPNVVTPEARLSFPNLFTARRNDLNDQDEYSSVLLFPKDADLSELKAEAKAACVKKWGTDQKKWPRNLRSPFRDQGEKARENDDGEMVMPEGHEEGAIFINTKSKQQPDVLDGRNKPITDQTQIYGGVWAKALVTAYAYDNKGNRGVAFGLNGIQKIRDDDPLGNRVRADQAFTPVEDDTAEQAGGDTDSLFS